MSRTKLLILSVIAGIVITIVLTFVALSVDSEKITGILLWQDVLMAYLIGPGPPLGVDAKGMPQYEGTPIHMLIIPAGFVWSIPFYSMLSYFVLRRVLKKRE